MMTALSRALEKTLRRGPPRRAGAARPIPIDDVLLAHFDDPRLDVATRSALIEVIDQLDQLREDNARLTARVAELQDCADVDVLTPTFNRRAFLRESRRLLGLARRHGLPVSLIFGDLDDFKTVSDRHGHAVGDQVLIHVAGVLAAAVRETDVVGRLGGDEFAVTLFGADGRAAHDKARAIERQIAATPVIADGRGHVVSASFGAVAVDPDAMTLEDALAQADAAMYARKRGGGPTR